MIVRICFWVCAALVCVAGVILWGRDFVGLVSGQPPHYPAWLLASMIAVMGLGSLSGALRSMTRALEAFQAGRQ